MKLALLALLALLAPLAPLVALAPRHGSGRTHAEMQTMSLDTLVVLRKSMQRLSRSVQKG